MKKIQNINIKNKNVLVRSDLNTPISDGKVIDNFRIEKSLETIKYLIENEAKRIVVLSHLGQPENNDKKFSLKPVAIELTKLLKLNSPKNIKLEGLDGFQINNNIYLMENVRFQKGERDNNFDLAKKWAKLGDIFIFDGFASAHREESSTVGVTKILPSFAGLLVQKEIEHLDILIKKPKKPLCVILGGAKTQDKLPVIKNLFGIAQTFIVSGGTANTFLAAKDLSIGKSLYDENFKKDAIEIMNMILDDPVRDIFIPQDLIVSKSREKPINVKTVSQNQVGPDDYIVDIGPKTLEMIEPKILESKTVFWNGSIGVAEVKEFGYGTKKIAEIMASSEGKTIVAGGDTTAAVNKFGLLSEFDFVSTGGGAALEYLAGKRLPGLEALTN